MERIKEEDVCIYVIEMHCTLNKDSSNKYVHCTIAKKLKKSPRKIRNSL
jgi:hypothetical protein